MRAMSKPIVLLATSNAIARRAACAGAALSLLALVAWILSGWWSLGWCSARGDYVFAEGGRLHLARQTINNYPTRYQGWTFGPADTPFGWWWAWRAGSGGYRVAVPLWAISLISASAALGAWKLGHRTLPGTCPRCHYDRSGLAPDRVCPECGTSR